MKTHTESQNPNEILRWYALYTRSKYERKIELELSEKGFESYVPVHTVIRQWSDRRKKLVVPLFSSYAFIRMQLKQRMAALQTDGVIFLVRFNGQPSPIRDFEIEAVRRVLDTTNDFEQVTYLPTGEEVEVIRGPLMGVRGRILEYHGSKRLVIGIEQINHGLSVKVHLNDVKPVGRLSPFVY